MGIDTKWKEYLQQDYPHCFHEFLPEDVNITTAIDDFTSRMFSFVSHATGYQEILRRSNKLIQENVGGLEKYIILFDEFTPPNKRVKATKTKFPAYTIEELKQNNIFVPNGRFPDSPERLITTHVLKRDLYRFLSNEVCPKFDDGVYVPPHNCSIILDGVPENGGRGCHIYQLNKYHSVKVDNYSPDNFSVIQSSGELGEADLKVPFYISRCKEGENILVINSDGDLIPILLLNMRDWIDPVTKKIKYNIWLYNKKNDVQKIGHLYESNKPKQKERKEKKEKKKKKEPHFDRDDPRNAMLESLEIEEQENELLNPTAKKEKEEKPKKNLINVCDLFRAINSRFSGYGIDCGVVIMALLFLSHENDFTDKMQAMGPAAIWNAFTKGKGYQILSGSPLQTLKSVNPMELRDLYPREEVFDVEAFSIGEHSVKHKVLLNENRIKMWLRYILQYSIKGKPRYSGDIDNLTELASALKQKMGSKPMNNRSPVIPSSDELGVKARQMLWCLDYMINGGKIISGQRNFPNPLDIDKNGVSVWGWIYNEKEKKVEKAKKVITV
jgi:hypothetical protein